MMCVMLRCCVPTCTTRLFSFWAAMTALPSLEVVRQRLLDVHVLARLARVDGQRDVPVIGRRDQHRVHVLAGEQFLVLLGGERLRVGDLLPLVEVLVPDVADRRDLHVGQFRERLHEVSAPPAHADEADLQCVVGGEPAGRFDGKARGEGGGQERAAVGCGHWRDSRGKGENRINELERSRRKKRTPAAFVRGGRMKANHPRYGDDQK